MELRLFKVHAFYVFGILLLIIIGLVTVQWGRIPTLVQYITFALTITSLVLAVLAIIYAFLSNSSISQAVGTIKDLSREVNETASNLSRVTHELKGQLREIEPDLKEVKGKISETNFMLKAQSAKLIADQEITRPKAETDNIADSFLTRSPISGLWTLYICSIAHNKNMTFDLKELTVRCPGVSENYFRGFATAAAFAGLLSFRFIDNKMNVINMNERLTNSIAVKVKKAIAEEPDRGWKELIDIITKEIEKFFEVMR